MTMSVWRRLGLLILTLNYTDRLFAYPDVLRRLRVELNVLSKKPKHIGFILNSQPVSLKDLSRFVIWCSLADIHYITLYDLSGSIQSAEIKFQKKVREMQQLMLGDSSNVSVRFHIPNGIDRHERNGLKHTLHVCLASYWDGGEGALVNAAKEICTSTKDPDSITANDISAALNVMSDWPEPDLILRTEGIHSHLGYLPWHIRLTEFIDLPSHHNMVLSEFVSVLRRFSKCDQRFGR